MAPLSRPAQYMLRIDDICPTMHRESWMRLVAMIREFRLRPILAVIPENHDPGLRQSPEAPELWAELRSLQAEGAAIGLHGFRHVCASHGRSLIPIHRETEFAGLPVEVQRKRLHTGLDILRNKGLHPSLWVAPRHGFDAKTLAALQSEGIMYLSDGMARRPHLRGGVVWLPQQLWSPVMKDAGLWTICLHPGAPLLAQMPELRAFVEQHSAQFTSFDRVRAEHGADELNAGERLHEAASIWRLRLRLARKRMRSARSA